MTGGRRRSQAVRRSRPAAAGCRLRKQSGQPCIIRTGNRCAGRRRGERVGFATTMEPRRCVDGGACPARRTSRAVPPVVDQILSTRSLVPADRPVSNGIRARSSCRCGVESAIVLAELRRRLHRQNAAECPPPARGLRASHARRAACCRAPPPAEKVASSYAAAPQAAVLSQSRSIGMPILSSSVRCRFDSSVSAANRR